MPKKNEDQEPEVVIEDTTEKPPEQIPEPEPQKPKAQKPREPEFDLEKFAAGIVKGTVAALREPEKPDKTPEKPQEQHAESRPGAGEQREPIRPNFFERFLGVDPNRKPGK